MKTFTRLSSLIAATIAFTMSNALADIDARTNSWFTTYSGKYARIYTSDVNKTNGNAVTTWSTGNTTQASPVYSGVQEIYSSSNWVYLRSSGLSSHVMGPWYLDTNHQMAFPNYPTNQHALYRIPRVPTVVTNKTRNAAGAIGYFVDGVAMFNSWDANYYTNGADTQGGNNGGYWNRDAYVNEGASFDPNNAHQAGGWHHYHANPPGLRYLLGDHVDFNPVTKAYPESTNTPTKHSPILGWVADGYPIYGPYGYSVSNDASSGVRRMISGYTPRNGQKGNQNLAVTTRAALPQWAVRLFNVSSNVQSGPTVSTASPIGKYMEDNDFMGDLGIQPGTNTYDLDEYNGRWCVTPEFPGGTYAYFVSISSNGTPVFPYNIGRGYYGVPNGGGVTSITEGVITNFLGQSNSIPVINTPSVKNGAVVLTWSANEGGTYLVESTTNFTSWTTNSTSVSAVMNNAAYTNNAPENLRFYRVARTALANYDSVGTGGGVPAGPTINVPGGSLSISATQNFSLNITLATGGSNPPMLPMAGAPITSVVLSNSVANVFTATSSADTTQGIVLANFSLLTSTPTGTYDVIVTFGIPPGMSNAPKFTTTGGFMINP